MFSRADTIGLFKEALERAAHIGAQRSQRQERTISGSDESGEEIQSSRTNRAENRTKIWAQRNEDEQFDGEAILVVESAFDIENDDFRQVSDTQDGYETRLAAFGRVSLQMGELNRSTLEVRPEGPFG
jgi:hypothetical protein